MPRLLTRDTVKAMTDHGAPSTFVLAHQSKTSGCWCRRPPRFRSSPSTNRHAQHQCSEQCPQTVPSPGVTCSTTTGRQHGMILASMESTRMGLVSKPTLDTKRGSSMGSIIWLLGSRDPGWTIRPLAASRPQSLSTCMYPYVRALRRCLGSVTKRTLGVSWGSTRSH